MPLEFCSNAWRARYRTNSERFIIEASQTEASADFEPQNGLLEMHGFWWNQFETLRRSDDRLQRHEDR